MWSFFGFPFTRLLYSRARFLTDEFYCFGRAKPSIIVSEFPGVVRKLVRALLVWLIALVGHALLPQH